MVGCVNNGSTGTDISWDKNELTYHLGTTTDSFFFVGRRELSSGA